MEIRKETISMFNQDKQYVMDYLKFRKVKNEKLRRIIQDQPFGLLKDTSFYIDSEEYGISYFLAKSDIGGYDIQKVNELLKTDLTDIVVFAVVIGDDVLCYDTKNKKVLLWQIQTGNGKQIHVSDDLTKFLEMLE